MASGFEELSQFRDAQVAGHPLGLAIHDHPVEKRHDDALVVVGHVADGLELQARFGFPASPDRNVCAQWPGAGSPCCRCEGGS